MVLCKYYKNYYIAMKEALQASGVLNDAESECGERVGITFDGIASRTP